MSSTKYLNILIFSVNSLFLVFRSFLYIIFGIPDFLIIFSAKPNKIYNLKNNCSPKFALNFII